MNTSLQRFTTFLSSFFYAVFIVVLVAVAGLFLVSLVRVPGNIEIKIVKSGSMEPAITTGSIVVVKSADSYAVGDVITFGEDTKRQIPTTHRIVSIEGEGESTEFTTKGDANEEIDPSPVAFREVIGRVAFDVPYAGYILDFARQPVGFLLLIGIPAGIIIVDESMRIVREVMYLRRSRRKEIETN